MENKSGSKVILEEKQGEALMIENHEVKPTKKIIFGKLWMSDEFF